MASIFPDFADVSLKSVTVFQNQIPWYKSWPEAQNQAKQPRIRQSYPVSGSNTVNLTIFIYFGITFLCLETLPRKVGKIQSTRYLYFITVGEACRSTSTFGTSVVEIKIVPS